MTVDAQLAAAAGYDGTTLVAVALVAALVGLVAGVVFGEIIWHVVGTARRMLEAALMAAGVIFVFWVIAHFVLHAI